MKKKYIGLLIALIFLVLTFGFNSSISADDLIHGVVPTKVTSHFTGEGDFGPFDWNFNFWNVGTLGGEEYSKATATYTKTSDKDILNSGTHEGTFSGGPNGTLTFKTIEGYDSGEMVLQLKDGKYIDCGEYGMASIDNPEAFNGWVDKEISTTPTINLSILEGPVKNEDGKTYNFIVDAEVTGNPEPEISFNRDDSEGSLGPYNAQITMERDQEFTVEATATNTAGSVSAEIILSTKNIKPESNTLTIVIPADYPGFGIKDTKIEVNNGVVDSVISYNGFDNVPIKGTYDQEKGVINATITIAPQHDTANLWLGFDGNLTVDLSKEKTAGFMDITGNMWQWTEDDGKWQEGDDKGPPGDYNQRVYYTVEYPDGQPEESADSKQTTELVDSNLRFWNGPSLSASLNADINCFIKHAGSNELEKVDQNTVINVGDTLITPPGSGNVIIYPKDDRDSGIHLQPGTNFTISGQTNFLVFGEFLYKAKHNPKSGFYEQFDNFETQLARMKVKLKGTIVVIKEDGKTSSVKVLEGMAECTETETGKTVEVNAGKMVLATEKGIGEVQAFDISKENTKWEKGLQAISEVSSGTENVQNHNSGIAQNLKTSFKELGIPSWFITVISIMVFLLLIVLVVLAVVFLRNRKQNI